MTLTDDMTDEEFERHALFVLSRELGLAGYARYLRLCRSGKRRLYRRPPQVAGKHHPQRHRHGNKDSQKIDRLLPFWLSSHRDLLLFVILSEVEGPPFAATHPTSRKVGDESALPLAKIISLVRN